MLFCGSFCACSWMLFCAFMGDFCLVLWMIVYGSMDNFCEFMDDFVLIHG